MASSSLDKVIAALQGCW